MKAGLGFLPMAPSPTIPDTDNGKNVKPRILSAKTDGPYIDQEEYDDQIVDQEADEENERK